MDARKLEALANMLAEERLARQAAERTAVELDTRLGEMAKLEAGRLATSDTQLEEALERVIGQRDAACAEASRLAQELAAARLATQDADERAQARERERDEARAALAEAHKALHEALRERDLAHKAVDTLEDELARARIENDPHRYDQSMGPSYGEGDKT
jgi:chromosome segregation ATPase